MRHALFLTKQALVGIGRRIAGVVGHVWMIVGHVWMIVGHVWIIVSRFRRRTLRACGRGLRALGLSFMRCARRMGSVAARTTRASVGAVRRAVLATVTVLTGVLATGARAARRMAALATRAALSIVALGATAVALAIRGALSAVGAGLRVVARAGRVTIACGHALVCVVAAAGARAARVASRVARQGGRAAALLARESRRTARLIGPLIRPPLVILGRLPRLLIRRTPVRRTRLWLILGIGVAGVAGLSSIASISLLPPSMHTKSIAFAIASSEMSVQTPTSSGNAPELRNLYPLPQWAAVLAEEMTSPALKAQIAEHSGIPGGQLAIDGPIALNLQRTQQEPTQQKRSYQLLSEDDPYRVTLDTDPNVAAIIITAQAPSQSLARQLTREVDRAAAAYLGGVEKSANLPPADRVEVSQLQPIAITGGSGGHTVAALVFVVVYLLWCGGVLVVRKLARDVRALRRLGPVLPSQVAAQAVRSSIGSNYSNAGKRLEGH